MVQGAARVEPTPTTSAAMMPCGRSSRVAPGSSPAQARAAADAPDAADTDGSPGLSERRRSMSRRLSFSNPTLDAAELEQLRQRKPIDQWVIPVSSRYLAAWNFTLVIMSIYVVVSTPLLIAFPRTRYPGHQSVDAFIDASFMVGIVVVFRTSYMSRGELIFDSKVVALHYLRSWFFFDLVSALPLYLIASSIARACGASPELVDALLWLRLLKVLRGRLIIQQFRKLTGANVVRVIQMLMGFVVFAHYLGCFWYAWFVRPLETDAEIQDAYDWMWHDEAAYETATLYVCSIYWALGVMTNLKGIGAHETRQCLWRDPLIIRPLEERIYTISVFIVGATFYSIIYGNIGQFVANLYQAGLRYKRRMAEIDEFISFHNLSATLGKRIRKYVDFAFSVTKGMNVDAVASQLPPHLMLEVYLQLNRQMVRQVSIFDGCSEDFYHAVVMKLQPTICTAGDYVFYRGEIGERMYFVKRGRIQVIISDVVVHTFTDNGYFGEIALIADMPRTADLKCVSNCMLLSLSAADLDSIFSVHPQAREIFMVEAQQRLSQLEAMNSTKQSDAAGFKASLDSRIFSSPSLDAATVITGPKVVARNNLKRVMRQTMDTARDQGTHAGKRRPSLSMGPVLKMCQTVNDAVRASMEVPDIVSESPAASEYTGSRRPSIDGARPKKTGGGTYTDRVRRITRERMTLDARVQHMGSGVRSPMNSDGPGSPFHSDGWMQELPTNRKQQMRVSHDRRVSHERLFREATSSGDDDSRDASPKAPLRPGKACEQWSGERRESPLRRAARQSKERVRQIGNEVNQACSIETASVLMASEVDESEVAAQAVRLASRGLELAVESGSPLPFKKVGKSPLGLAPATQAGAEPSNNTASKMSSLPELQSQLEKLVSAIKLLAAETGRSQDDQLDRHEQMQQLVEAQQCEMRAVVETLVTQVNDISRTLTETSRSQSRWM